MLNHEVDQWDLSGQVALVTGGTRGLGQAFARGLSAAGARVVITGRSADRVEAVVAELSTPANQVVGMAADVVDADAAVRVVAQVEHDVGPITLLVNNAGIIDAIGAVGVVDPSRWWRVVETNVRDTFCTPRPSCRRCEPDTVVGSPTSPATRGSGRCPSGPRTVSARPRSSD